MMKTIRKPQNLVTIIMLFAALILYVMSFWVKENGLKEILKAMTWGFVGGSVGLRFMLKWKIGDKNSE